MQLLLVSFESHFGISTFKNILDENHFYYYNSGTEQELKANPTILTKNNILQLLLPDPEKGTPLFFISLQDRESKEIHPFEFHKSNSTEAEQPDAFYAEKSCVFPFMTTFTENELNITRTQLNEPSKEFREKIKQWAQLCYDNPNSNEGLNFFRKNLTDWLPSTENLPLESTVLKNGAAISYNNLQSQMWIGEMPIEKIWEHYLKSKTITQDSYEDLLKIKAEQSPKFDGRWPVVLYQCIDNHLAFSKDLDNESKEMITSVRKTILLD